MTTAAASSSSSKRRSRRWLLALLGAALVVAIGVVAVVYLGVPDKSVFGSRWNAITTTWMKNPLHYPPAMVVKEEEPSLSAGGECSNDNGNSGVDDIGDCPAEARNDENDYREQGEANKEQVQTEEVESFGEVQTEEVETEEVQESSSVCTDEHERCEEWATIGECDKNPAYMLNSCRKACLVCGQVDIDMGVQQTMDADGALPSEQMEKHLQETEEYMRSEFGSNPKRKRLLALCKNKHEKCTLWSVKGECESNPAFMKTNCAPACRSCHELDISARCPIDPEKMPNAWKPGDVNQFFLNLTTLDEYKQYEPQVLSSPTQLANDDENELDYNIGGPWVVVLDNVISDVEAERMIELGTKQGYEPSYAGGKLLADGSYERGYSDIRTSSNTWCERSACTRDPIAQTIVQRIANITRIPQENSEFLQLLKYEPGQFYKTHHDYLEHNLERQCGVRLMTVFLYLNEVEEGGGTEFPDYNITVEPKRGRALIWPSVKDEAPDEQDPRTMHQALPVIKGVKYGANAWIHQRDFKNPFRKGCN